MSSAAARRNQPGWSLLSGGVLGLVRAGSIVLLTRGLVSALILVALGVLGTIAAGASAMAMRQRQGRGLAMASRSFVSIGTAAAAQILVMALAHRTPSLIAIVAGAALAGDLILQFRGWSLVERLVKRRQESAN